MSNKISLSPATIAVLNKASIINGSLKIKPNEKHIKTVASTSTIAMFANIDEEFPREFNIYDVKSFLKTMGLIENPVLDFSETSYVSIQSEDGTQKTSFHDANASLIQTYLERLPTLPSEDIVVELSEEQFNHVMKAANVMGLQFVGFYADGKTSYFMGFNRNDSGEKINTFSLELGETDSVYDMFYKLATQDLSVLAKEGGYKFSISAKKISKIETTAGNQFFITLDTKSKFTS